MRLTLCVAILGLVTFSPASVLSDAAAAMKAGEWKELQAPGMDYNMLYTDVNGAGSLPVTDYSDNLTWDPAGNEALYVGSGNYYTYKFLRYSAATNAWRSDTNLPACMKNRGCSWHAFDNNSMDEVNRRYYFIVSSGLFTYSIGSAQWSPATPLPSTMAVGVGSAMEFFPSLNSLASVIGGKVTLYHLTTHQVSTAATGLTMSSYNQVMAYSPPFAKAFFGGDGAGNFYSLDSAKKVTKLANAPGRLHEAYSTLTVDPVTGRILYLGDSESANTGKLFAYDPASNAWSSAGNAPQTGHALATPISNHGVVLFLFPGSYKTYIYKHAASTAAEARRLDLSSGAITVSPNPVHGTAMIDVPAQASAGIYNLRGQKMAAFIPGRHCWRTSSIPAGVYLVRALYSGQNSVTRVTVIR